MRWQDEINEIRRSIRGRLMKNTRRSKKVLEYNPTSMGKKIVQRIAAGRGLIYLVA